MPRMAYYCREFVSDPFMLTPAACKMFSKIIFIVKTSEEFQILLKKQYMYIPRIII